MPLMSEMMAAIKQDAAKGIDPLSMLAACKEQMSRKGSCKGCKVDDKCKTSEAKKLWKVSNDR